MKAAIRTLICMLLPGMAVAQVHVDKPVVFTSGADAERQVQGLAPAASTTSLITATGGQSGRYHWAQAAGTAMAITLSLDPPWAAYLDGSELRFMPVANSFGPVTVNVDGLGARHVYRGDGLPISAGQMGPGTIVSLIYADTAFFLTDRSRAGCPDGFLPVNGQYCIQRNDTVNLSVFNATKWCNDRGARLCSWGEYLHACTVQQSQMEGMFNDWEWIDDSADHTHTGVQAGRYTCLSERSYGAIENPNNYARTRCCFTLK